MRQTASIIPFLAQQEFEEPPWSNLCTEGHIVLRSEFRLLKSSWDGRAGLDHAHPRKPDES